MQGDTIASVSSWMSVLGSAAGFAGLVVNVALLLLLLAASWKIYTKAGKPGWAALVPIYNIIVMLRIAGKPLWWMLLLLIPFVNVAVIIILNFSLARVFGKSPLFGMGLMLLGIVFYPILAFGDARYQGAALASA